MRTARIRGRAHDAHGPAVGLTPGGTVIADDVRDLQSWSNLTDGAIAPAASGRGPRNAAYAASRFSARRMSPMQAGTA
jgi:hypothetical protein